MNNTGLQAAPAISAVLTDVDGTLVTKDKVLTERALRAVKQLRERGIVFTITSGRPPFGMRMLVEPLGLTMPMAAFNGGVIVLPDLSVLDERLLPDSRVAPALALIHERLGEAWTVAKLAAKAGLSRSAFTVRFTKVVGESPAGVSYKGCRGVVSFYMACQWPEVFGGAARLSSTFSTRTTTVLWVELGKCSSVRRPSDERAGGGRYRSGKSSRSQRAGAVALSTRSARVML
jgi:AraC-like DNA-binding protein